MINTIILTLMLPILSFLALAGTYYLIRETKWGWLAALWHALGSTIIGATVVLELYLVVWACVGETVQLLTQKEWQLVQKVRKEQHIIQLKKELSELEGRNHKAVQ